MLSVTLFGLNDFANAGVAMTVGTAKVVRGFFSSDWDFTLGDFEPRGLISAGWRPNCDFRELFWTSNEDE
jgi:hypothetical protein